MDINNNPDISFPAVRVIVNQPGAAPSELETQVTQRVEAAARGISGVAEITSYASEGTSETFAQFVIGTPVDRAVNDLRTAIAQIRSAPPDGKLEPQVIRVDLAGGHINYFNATDTDTTRDELSEYTTAERDIGKER